MKNVSMTYAKPNSFSMVRSTYLCIKFIYMDMDVG